ncbi:carbamoyl phosphate synthase large subunit [Candidatus Uzinura diaspidicola str. ASNER]|uniref:Carbamoyl phosphate synthase arginine-specific large chain n=1 Tax=Candidatus Uzinura diaspidicola str. ASNER TaxID=1133592 RepID=L7VN58_9FLAO|nr:carbamoyl phosphate synthase large subunit [Candidatus Uzinura diaspidicola str. ASNER]
MKKILIIGSGSLKIGEAGEFDYSGTQALKAIKEEGLESVLINPNIATVQTSDSIADKIYFLPITQEFVEKVIEKEKPQGILLSFGGQTALNCGIQLFERDILKQHSLKVLGTNIEDIISSEDRDRFVTKLNCLHINTARNKSIRSRKEAIKGVKEIGFPLIIRVAYALGGLGSGFANNGKELDLLVDKALVHASQILLEESLKGWKEIEYEVVRDKHGNCITICNMENIDPIGIHTGESIVVAPSQTLTDKESQKLRMFSIQIAHAFNIIGECNVQFALSPISEDYRVIEINARLSRSSALASKATGYPLAFIAAKLALGYGLHELKNAVTHHTSSFFEPTLDYIVCKFPRWDFKKFWRVSNKIGSSMKSVGEVMAIGGTFEEAFQKGLRMLDNGLEGFINTPKYDKTTLEKLKTPTDSRIEAIEEAFNKGCSIEQLYNITYIDPWYLYRLRNLHYTKEVLYSYKDKKSLPEEWLYIAKKQGFSDRQIAMLLQYNLEKGSIRIRKIRKILGILPYTRQIDTMSAEFPAKTNYLYMSYHATQQDVAYEKNYKESVVILGSGVYRIGSSVEFDWCCVNAVKALNNNNYRSIIINCNPETVSTDFDVCSRLYFEELSFERVVDIIELECPIGTVVSMGGQGPNNLALKLFHTGKKLLGPSSLSIDGVEDRYKFSEALDLLGIQQPLWRELANLQSILHFVNEVGFPVLIRPSYVLSGAAMHVVFNVQELESYLKEAVYLSPKHPVVVSKFLENYKEIELDAIADKGSILYHSITEHVEFAGVHSGDATLIYPTKNIDLSTLKEAEQIAQKIAEYFYISGPFNIQFLLKGNLLSVIECNLRASRSFPFVSKVSGFNMIRFSTELLIGKLSSSRKLTKKLLPYFLYFNHVGIKAAQFSFSRLHGADPVLGVDMASIGEVGSLGRNLDEALIKAMIAVGYRIPMKNILISGDFVYVHYYLREICKLLIYNGYTIFSTERIRPFFLHYNLPSNFFNFSSETQMFFKKLDLIINIPKKIIKNELDNDYIIRRASVDFNIPLFTNARLAQTFINAFCNDELQIKDWKSYFFNETIFKFFWH